MLMSFIFVLKANESWAILDCFPSPPKVSPSEVLSKEYWFFYKENNVLNTSGSVITSCTYFFFFFKLPIKPGQCRDIEGTKRRVCNEMYCWLCRAQRFRVLISGLWFLLASTGFSAMTHTNRKADEISLAVTGMCSLYDLKWDLLTSELDMIRAEEQQNSEACLWSNNSSPVWAPHPPQIREWCHIQHPCM